jgi:hypothetical protein
MAFSGLLQYKYFSVVVRFTQGGFTKGERTSSLLYIAFPAISGASSVKIWHPPRAGREKGSEMGRGRGMDVLYVKRTEVP